MPSLNPSSIRTRLLILADTEGVRCLPDARPLQPIDVVIHCGDITGTSQISEYRTALQLLRAIDAPLKLVIPGNHDFTLDTPTFQHMCAKASGSRLARIHQLYGLPGQARQLFADAAAAARGEAGVTYLEEGTHRFALANGAELTVYASPYTPAFGSPGFQYTVKEGHQFAIPDDVDVVVTHGPPRGVLDRSWATGQHVGSAELFTAVARARPRVHCFGHIHEGWGAELVTWRDERGRQGSSGSQGSGSDQGARRNSSTVLADLGSILPLKGDAVDRVKEKERRLGEYARGKCVKTSHCAGDALPVEAGINTLFVNAAVVGSPMRPPWVVDIELPVAEVNAGFSGKDERS